MASIAALFNTTVTRRPPVDDERVLDLYWNRNELKKEFAVLRRQKYRLTERVKHQQGDIARLEQKYQQLEALLADPAAAGSVLVHYQLRGLGQRCARKVATFAEQIKQQRERKKHNAAVLEWQARIAADTGVLEGELQALGQRRFDMNSEEQSVQQSFAEMGAFMRLIRRRGLRSTLTRLRQEAEEVGAREAALQEEIEAIRSTPPPEVRGLVIAEKRLINLMILAYAQQLYLAFEDDELVSLVKEACDLAAGSLQYGDKDACGRLLARAEAASIRLQQGTDAALLKRHAALLAEDAAFAGDDHAVPEPGTVACIFRLADGMEQRAGSVDLLGENYWELSAALSR